MTRVTLGTIAAQTGLSKYAVSRSLSGKDGVSEETRQRVLEVAAHLGYARSGSAAESPLIRVIFHDADVINSELHMMLQNGMHAEAKRLGYRVGMRWIHDPEEIEANALACDGLVLVGPHDHDALARAYATGTPIVRSGWLRPLEPVDQVQGTDHEAGNAVGQLLLDLGHRSIVYVHGTTGYRGRMERYYGLREVLENVPDMVLRDMRFDTEVKFPDRFKSLQDEGVFPTAFFCAHDGLAVNVVSELLRLGYRIPDDVTVVGFGDYASATQVSPQLTTVKMHGYELGAACVRLLDDRIHKRIDPARAIRVHIAGTIVLRDSSGPAPSISRPARKSRSGLAVAKKATDTAS